MSWLMLESFTGSVSWMRCGANPRGGAHQTSGAHLPGAVAALAAQVLPVGQEAAGSSSLQRQPGVNEGGGAAVMIHKEGLEENKPIRPVTNQK